ncbi:MAG: efflux RND transporter permease subunit [Anaerovoracaceae bacterium]
MERFFHQVVRLRKPIIILFLLMSLISIVMQKTVNVNYDMADYLPEDTSSTVSLKLMEEEFDGGIPNARVMIKNVTIPEALSYKEKIMNCEGVSDVLWLDNSENILQPLENMDPDVVDSYYKDNSALFTVTIDERKQVEATNAIRDIIGEENAMTGDAISTATATTGTVSEINKITIIAVIFVFLVLIVTTTSWMEPLLVMAGLGVAILINNGTNAVFGEISFVTNAAGTILQMAVSLDYSVFLIHRFEECLKDNPNSKQAIVDALMKSSSSILSSGLTTVIGFLALVFMHFRIGPDLGLALAKGISISLITVFTFMPALILLLRKYLVKTHHRSFLPSFHRFGRFVCRIMIPLSCIFMIAVIPAYLASNSNSFYYGSSHIYDDTTQLGRDTADIEKIYGKSDSYAIMVPRGDTASEQKLSKALHDIPQVENITSYVDTVGEEIPMEYLDQDSLSQLVSDNYSRFIITVDADYEGDETFDLVSEIRDVADTYYPDSWYMAGSGVSTYDLMDTTTKDMVKVNLIAVGAIFIVLLLTLRSVSLPVILVVAIETAVWINLAIPYFRGATVFYISYLIISSIQLGATVDYAILFTERYLEFRRVQYKKTAITETISAVTPSVMTSGTVLAVVGFLLGFISNHGILSQLGMFIGFGSLLSLSVVLFILPGMMYMLDGFIRRTTSKADFLL